MGCASCSGRAPSISLQVKQEEQEERREPSFLAESSSAGQVSALDRPGSKLRIA